MRVGRYVLSLCALVAVFGCGGGSGSDNNGPVYVYGVTGDHRLVRFAMGTATVDMNIPITGIASVDHPVGIDFRASDGKLYYLASTGQLFTIDTTTAAATPVGEGNGFIPLNSAGFDFNDVTDRIRYVVDTDFNARLNPDNGEFIDGDIGDEGFQPDTAVHPTGDIGGLAYTPPSDDKTTLYGIDYGSNQLVRIGGVDGNPSPTQGLKTNIGALGVDVSGLMGFDIARDGTAILVNTPAADQNNVYTINLTTGVATLIGDPEIESRITAIAISR